MIWQLAQTHWAVLPEIF